MRKFIIILFMFALAACSQAIPTPNQQLPLRLEIAGHRLIVTGIAESLDNVKEQARSLGYTISEGEPICHKIGQTFPIIFDIPDAKVGKDLNVFGQAEAELTGRGGDPQVFGVFIKYANTSKWGFLPVMYYSGMSKDCANLVPLRLSGPTSTIPIAGEPRE